MTDPRKHVLRLDVDQGSTVLDTVHEHLVAATEKGARAIGATGASFVVIGMGVWAAELGELDGRASAKYLRALADLFDPTSNDNRKRRAEKDRSQAVTALFAALDLRMAEVRGRG